MFFWDDRILVLPYHHQDVPGFGVSVWSWGFTAWGLRARVGGLGFGDGMLAAGKFQAAPT